MEYKYPAEEEFIKGLELNEGYYQDVVKPLIEGHYPNTPYSAALIGHCSDVLGFDTWKSMDHVWGPRLQIFLRQEDYQDIQPALDNLFREELPLTYRGFPTNYMPGSEGVKCMYMAFCDGPPINHFIEIETVKRFFNRDISWDPEKKPTLEEWLTFPEQALVELTRGRVFHDGTGDLTRARECLSYYPDEVWLIKMYMLWHGISEEQAFVGRCHDVADSIGEHLILNRIVNKLMKLCFHLERTYYPYSKWFGTAFKRLRCAAQLVPLFEQALVSPCARRGKDYEERIDALARGAVMVAEMHNGLGLTKPVVPSVINYYNRNYRGLDAEPFARALEEALKNGILQKYDARILSAGFLADDSNFYGGAHTLALIRDAARR